MVRLPNPSSLPKSHKDRNRKDKDKDPISTHDGRGDGPLGVSDFPPRNQEQCASIAVNETENFNPGMAMSWTRGLKHGVILRNAAQLVESRSLAIASKAKKGGKGGAADAAKTPALSQELKSTTVFGANILKEGSDPKIQPDSEYPDWLWHLLDKRPVLSELRRKDPKTLPYEDLKRFVKLDNRSRIKEKNALTAKN
ncbi:unnamed protein product [Miscanthus lutarioriparius]|uniref:Large ribosomal subunit protein mL54 n=1 Tax=Miscanthus lutarioriparius TaxID=422564 RepID=A0A811N7U6_9POAL|nr:unnamed protein product [Miscanthus lutarioriparius]